METLWKIALWQQFGSSIDMLENALLACPTTLWQGHIWPADSNELETSEFWYLTYHTLFWLDLYITGSKDEFAPPSPFTLEQIDSACALPQLPYTKDELHTYLIYLRKKCRTTIAELSDERASRLADFTRYVGKPVSFLELIFLTMRHIQEHATQLNLFLGQNGIEASDWISQTLTAESIG